MIMGLTVSLTAVAAVAAFALGIFLHLQRVGTRSVEAANRGLQLGFSVGVCAICAALIAVGVNVLPLPWVLILIAGAILVVGAMSYTYRASLEGGGKQAITRTGMVLGGLLILGGIVPLAWAGQVSLWLWVPGVVTAVFVALIGLTLPWRRASRQDGQSVP